jgi:hypothetical protein
MGEIITILGVRVLYKSYEVDRNSDTLRATDQNAYYLGGHCHVQTVTIA